MPDIRNMIVNKSDVIKQQIMQHKRDGKIGCKCGKRLSIINMFRCLYCGEWYCTICAGEHFGKTKERYNQEKIAEYLSNRRCSGFGVFPDGTRCLGCSDCEGN